MSDNTRIAEIRERLERATPWPWRAIIGGNEKYPYPLSIESEDGSCWIARDGTTSSLDNARLLAAAPADVAWLLTRLEEAEKVMRGIARNMHQLRHDETIQETARKWLEEG